MNKEQIREKLLLEKNAKLIDILEINNKTYAKTLINYNGSITDISYKYFEIKSDAINEIENDSLEKVKTFFKIDYGNIVD